MKESRRRRLPLFWQLLLRITACWILLLSLTLTVTFRYSLTTFQNHVDDILMSTVVTLGNAPSVRRTVEAGVFDQEFVDYLNDVVNNTSDLQYITIANADSIRIYHINADFVGLPFEGNDEDRALAGEVYLSTATPENFGLLRRAFHPVRSEAGEVIGFVMAAATYERIEELRAGIIETYVSIGLLLSFLTLLACAALAMYLGRNLRGAKPDDIVRVYLAQNDILNALDEGMISFDTTGRVRLVNAAAAKMLGRREDLLIGQQVDDLLRAEDGSSLRNMESPGLQSNHPNVLVRPVQLPNANLWARQVLVLVDKSEVIRYAEELVGTRHMVNTLRAATHEFLNKLQVISGLLQMGRTEEAQTYIGTIANAHELVTSPVMKLIHNTSVAALILGKASHMRELDLELTLMQNSSLPEHSKYLSSSELVTVVGNLMENAIEAANTTPMDRYRGVAVQLTEDEKGLLIMVSDTGEGISEEHLPHIYEAGFSTKAKKGRGVGMNRIKQIVESHGGTIDVETEPGEGTTFTIILNQKRGGIL